MAFHLDDSRIHLLVRDDSDGDALRNYAGIGDAFQLTVGRATPEAGDLFILATDGLIKGNTGQGLTPARIERIARDIHDDPQHPARRVERVAHELAMFARRAGSQDDITVIVAEWID